MAGLERVWFLLSWFSSEFLVFISVSSCLGFRVYVFISREACTFEYEYEWVWRIGSQRSVMNSERLTFTVLYTSFQARMT